MKKYAADNLMFLREQYPEIYKIVRNQTYNKDLYIVETAKNGQPNLRTRGEDGSSYYMYSRYDPELEVRRWVDSVNDSVLHFDDVLIAGFGYGFHAAAFMNEYPDKRLYIYEPNLDVFLAAVEVMDLRSILENRQIAMFALGEDDFVRTNLLMKVYESVKGTFGHVVLPFCRRIAPTLQDQLIQLIPNLAQVYMTNVMTISHYKEEWLENLILNMERNLRTPSFVTLKDTCKGLPAVIVGSGPSLGVVADKLREIKEHVFIIAAGSSVQGLLHQGIEPDLIISMDGGEPNRRVFEKLDVGHIPFLYIPCIKYEAIRDDRSPYLIHGFFDIDVVSPYLMDITREDGILASTLSVTGTCIQVAAHLGFEEVIFVGQDFSYPGSRVYSDGVNHLGVWEQAIIDNAALWVANMAGEVNITNHSMLSLKRDVEAVIKAFPQILFYNASPIGAVIEHTETKSLEKLQEKYEDHKIPYDWFRQQIVQKLSCCSEQRTQKILKKIQHTRVELMQLQKHVSALEVHIQHEQRDLHAWFQQFELLWSSVIEHPIYTRIFSYLLTAERSHTERNWSDMFTEINIELKYTKLQACINPLFTGVRKLASIMDTSMTVLSENLDRRG